MTHPTTLAILRHLRVKALPGRKSLPNQLRACFASRDFAGFRVEALQAWRSYRSPI